MQYKTGVCQQTDKQDKKTAAQRTGPSGQRCRASTSRRGKEDEGEEKREKVGRPTVASAGRHAQAAAEGTGSTKVERQRRAVYHCEVVWHTLKTALGKGSPAGHSCRDTRQRCKTVDVQRAAPEGYHTRRRRVGLVKPAEVGYTRVTISPDLGPCHRHLLPIGVYRSVQWEQRPLRAYQLLGAQHPRSGGHVTNEGELAMRELVPAMVDYNRVRIELETGPRAPRSRARLAAVELEPEAPQLAR